MLTEHGTRIAPSTYYAAIKAGPSKRELSDRKMIEVIKKIHAANFSVYGVHKMWKKLLREGHDIGRDQVGRLMRIAGLRGVIRGGHKTFTTRRDDTAARFPDRVNRRWDTGVPDRIWVADFT
ncbi:MAG: IS3 family transposase [Candidatus Methylomirabilaceae bacterium]